MTLLDTHFGSLRERFPTAALTLLPSGAAVVAIPDVPLPAGWNQTTTNVRFVVPVGYPHAKPDCFWTDLGLRLAGGGLPQNSNVSPIPETGENYFWFSWHVSQWNPNRDNLLTYFRVIEGRLRPAR